MGNLSPKGCPHILKVWEADGEDVPAYAVKWRPVLKRCKTTDEHTIHRFGKHFWK